MPHKGHAHSIGSIVPSARSRYAGQRSEAQEKLRQEQEAILNTTVYAVYNNAKMYHAREVCGTQSNRRQLTVQEALLEGLGACPNCNPPVFTGY